MNHLYKRNTSDCRADVLGFAFLSHCDGRQCVRRGAAVTPMQTPQPNGTINAI
jgi:hypothetical protein